MMYWGDHMGTGEWIFSILGTLIIIGLIVALIVWAVSPRGGRGSSASATGESPREILDRRLANGELTAEQYQQLHETLEDGHARTNSERPPARPASAAS
jgi:putative membrane protein